jgi:hypothetical protein
VTTCSTPNCGQDAVLQWQRAGGDSEHDAYMTHLGDSMASARDARLVNMTATVAQLQAAHAAFPNTLDGNRLRARTQRQIDAVTADIAAVMAEPGPDLSALPATTVAVFGCATHAPSPDAAAQLHDTHCSTTPTGCGCALPVIPPSAMEPSLSPPPPPTTTPTPPPPPTHAMIK